MTRVATLLCLAVLAGCATYSVVESGPQRIGPLTVTPAQSWNKVPAVQAPGGAPTWTIDGLTLNSVSFFTAVKDGAPLIKSSRKEEYPLYRDSMLPDELADLIQSSVAKEFLATVSAPASLRPIKIGADTGVEVQFEMIGRDNLPRRVYAIGVVKDGLLNVILYQAPRMHYYDKDLAAVRALAAGATLD